MVAAVCASGEGVEDCAEGVQGQADAVVLRGSDGLGQVAADYREEDFAVVADVDEVDDEVVGSKEFCHELISIVSVMLPPSFSRVAVARLNECVPLSGALFNTLLAVTTFLSASSFLSSCRSGAISDCIDVCWPCALLRPSMYWASSSQSSSNDPSMRSVFDGAGILYCVVG